MRISLEGNMTHHRVVSSSFTLFVVYLTTFSIAQHIAFSDNTIMNNEFDIRGRPGVSHLLGGAEEDHEYVR
jgi:hypothetical protein